VLADATLCAMRPAALLIAIATACGRSHSAGDLDLHRIRVGEGRLRTDSVGGAGVPATYRLPASCADPHEPQLIELCDHLAATLGDRRFTDTATFVLIDAANTSDTDAVVTLGGELRDSSGVSLGVLKPESLRIPAGEQRTFALVDRGRQPQPRAAAAQIVVRGARLTEAPPMMHVEAIKTFDDYGKTVIQATLVNDIDRPGQAFVIASFHDAERRPMTRPFSVIHVEAHGRAHVQLVGPQGSKTAAIYVGDAI
jgi:hypothetical protein